MIDVHVAVMTGDNSEWKRQCLESLQNEPCHVHIVDGEADHVGIARLRGFSRGTQEYVSFVDPDDYVIPGAIRACVDRLDRNPQACGAYTDELVASGGKKNRSRAIRPWNPTQQLLKVARLHHLLVMRRNFVERHFEDLARWARLPNYLLAAAIAQYGPWIHVNKVGYVWRRHGAGVHQTHTRGDIETAMSEAVHYLVRAKKWA